MKGTIDGKFEHGYLVTVNLGTEILHGVLYHASPRPTSPPQPERRRRRGRRSRDPSHPKPNRSAYNFFFADKHSKLKALYPHREREFSKMIGESWSKLTVEERMVGFQPFIMTNLVPLSSCSGLRRFFKNAELRTRRDI